MNSVAGSPQVFRVAWSTGGVVAINEPGPDVRIQAGMGGPSVHEFRTTNHENLFADLWALGLPTVGASFAHSPDQFQGLRPPDFLAMSRDGKRWLSTEIRQRWREVAVAAGRANLMRLFDVASRVASGLTYSELRLSDLLNAYSVQLRSHLHNAKPKDYQAFKDLNSPAVYRAISALFWELAVLRDSLAEFASAFCFSQLDIRSMSGLRRFLNRTQRADQVAEQVLQITDPAVPGWVAVFSSYRDLFTHLAPMEQATGAGFAVQDLRVGPNGSPIPQIYYPLPSEVQELNRLRSKGVLFNTMDELAAASSRRHDRTSEPDALEYLHACTDRFALLATALIARSPVPPTPIRIGPEDLRGPIRVE